jgi:hypothetical protein
MARIVVAGYSIRHPLAGNLIAILHHLLGLRLLGHEVFYLEESGWERSCYDPGAQEYTDDPRTGMRAVRMLLDRYGADVPICYVNRESREITGARWDELTDRLHGADLLLNVGGVCWLPEFSLCSRRALIDKDPLFTQLGGFGGSLLGEHHLHFTYGTNIGRPGCSVPDAGVRWLPTVPPVVPDLWKSPSSDGLRQAPFTTIGSLNAYGSVTYQGERYGQKDEEFIRFLNLPHRTPQRLELTLNGRREEIARLHSHGWEVRKSGEISVDPERYRSYIAESRGEFSVAKQAYVKTHSGWFSDRSVCYLAAGLPVILQETGYSDWLTTTHGVMSFTSIEEAVACIEHVNSDYETHRRAARDLAVGVFSHEVVFGRLLETCLN